MVLTIQVSWLIAHLVAEGGVAVHVVPVKDRVANAPLRECRCRATGYLP